MQLTGTYTLYKIQNCVKCWSQTFYHNKKIRTYSECCHISKRVITLTKNQFLNLYEIVVISIRRRFGENECARGHKLFVPACHGNLAIKSHETYHIITPSVWHICSLIVISQRITELLQLEMCGRRRTTEACHPISYPGAFGSSQVINMS